MDEFWILLFVVGFIWFWLGAMQAKERAVEAARLACERHQLLFLDQTVSLQRFRLRRDSTGRVRLRRTYGFEFTTGGEERRSGWLEVQAGRVVNLHLDMEEGHLYDLH